MKLPLKHIPTPFWPERFTRTHAFAATSTARTRIRDSGSVRGAHDTGAHAMRRMVTIATTVAVVGGATSRIGAKSWTWIPPSRPRAFRHRDGRLLSDPGSDSVELLTVSRLTSVPLSPGCRWIPWRPVPPGLLLRHADLLLNQAGSSSGAGRAVSDTVIAASGGASDLPPEICCSPAFNVEVDVLPGICLPGSMKGRVTGQDVLPPGRSRWGHLLEGAAVPTRRMPPSGSSWRRS
jgi:hypothetical protein